MKHLILMMNFVFGLTFQSTNTDLSPKILKSIDKEIKKNWKGINVSRIPLLMENSKTQDLEFNADNAFILLNNTDTLAYLFVRRTNGCVMGGCKNSKIDNMDIIMSNNFTERYEHFDYMAILNKDLSIKKIKVLVYDGEYGFEITSKLWLKQFIGYQGEKLKYGSDIQAISGATVSAQSISDDIQLLVELAKKLRILGAI
ncbi:MAG: hypothetical protein DRJ07_18680 [Bacteroidetes bacterium]|nr:MAG: hypothetical protein DRJ07_18680 [Bacteroidota bacterium]